MKRAIPLITSLVLGVAIGFVARGAGRSSPPTIVESESNEPSALESIGREQPQGSTSGDRDSGAAHTPRDGIDRARSGGPSRILGESIDFDVRTERERGLQRYMAELEAERVALLGEPIHRPSGAPPLHSRFGAEALSTAWRSAMREESVEGEVEGVECSEHPCILFGRLEGDEEDVEELERSHALSAYSGDVLTLLLWAVSIEAAQDEAEAEETALFALAYYSREERESLGSGLDRRIRARVMDVWNTQRPARTTAGSAENASAVR